MLKDILLQTSHSLVRECLASNSPLASMVCLLSGEQGADSLGMSAESLVEVALEDICSVGINDFQSGRVVDGDAVGREADDCVLVLLSVVLFT